GIIGLHHAAHAVLGAGEAGDHEPLVVQWRAGDAVTVLPVGGLYFPGDLAAGLVEGHEARIELADVYVVLAHAHATAGPAAADALAKVFGQHGLVLPALLATGGVDGEYVIGTGHH